MKTIQLSKSLIAFLSILVAASSFALKGPAGPTITQATGNLSNDTLVITGTNFSSPVVNLDDMNLVVSSSTSTTINATLPFGFGPGSYHLRVTTSGGIANIDLALDNGDFGTDNTAKGKFALAILSTGVQNTAFGSEALVGNNAGSYNSAVGAFALSVNADGHSNNAFGDDALVNNVHGSNNTAVGDLTLVFNDQSGSGTANNNTALGAGSLFNNIDGANSTAVGLNALSNSAGDYNTALGANAGTDPGIVSNNIYIGDAGFNGDTNVIAIGGVAASGTNYTACFVGGTYGATVNAATALPVYIDTDGHLGTIVAGADGKPGAAPLRRREAPQHQTMLNRGVDRLQATVAQQQKQIAHQQKQIETLITQLKEQAALIQKVSAQVEIGKATSKVVNNR